MHRDKVAQYWQKAYRGDQPPIMRWNYSTASARQFPAIGDRNIYTISAPNPAAPAFWSASKHYWGDAERLQALGDLTACPLIQAEEISLEQMQWNHLNVWDCLYTLRANKVIVNQVLVEFGEQYLRCIKPVFYNLCVSTDGSGNGPWHPVQNRFWGLEGFLAWDGGQITEATLFAAVQSYDSLEAAQADMSDADKLDFACICDEIFGDG